MRGRGGGQGRRAGEEGRGRGQGMRGRGAGKEGRGGGQVGSGGQGSRGGGQGRGLGQPDGTKLGDQGAAPGGLPEAKGGGRHPTRKPDRNSGFAAETSQP